jgi:hypothetical protein
VGAQGSAQGGRSSALTRTYTTKVRILSSSEQADLKKAINYLNKAINYLNLNLNANYLN